MASEPKTKPTAITPAPEAASRPLWRPKRTGKTVPPAGAGDDTKGTP